MTNNSIAIKGLIAIGLISAAASLASFEMAFAQSAQPTPPAFKWEKYTIQPAPGGQAFTVFDGQQPVGMVVAGPDGKLQMVPAVTGAAADELKASFDRYQKSNGVGAMPVGTVNAVAPAVTPSANPDGSSCTAMYGISYWDGSVWKPMVLAAHIGAERGASLSEGIKALGRNPFNSRAGLTSITSFKNPEATLTLEPSPKFCVRVPANFDPTIIMIGVLDVKKDHRELETCAGRCASKGRTTDDWMPEKRIQPVDINRTSDTLVEITPKTPLASGQYIIGGPPLIGNYDFGVKAGK